MFVYVRYIAILKQTGVVHIAVRFYLRKCSLRATVPIYVSLLLYRYIHTYSFRSMF